MFLLFSGLSAALINSRWRDTVSCVTSTTDTGSQSKLGVLREIMYNEITLYEANIQHFTSVLDHFNTQQTANTIILYVNQHIKNSNSSHMELLCIPHQSRFTVD